MIKKFLATLMLVTGLVFIPHTPPADAALDGCHNMYVKKVQDWINVKNVMIGRWAPDFRDVRIRAHTWYWYCSGSTPKVKPFKTVWCWQWIGPHPTSEVEGFKFNAEYVDNRDYDVNPWGITILNNYQGYCYVQYISRWKRKWLLVGKNARTYAIATILRHWANDIHLVFTHKGYTYKSFKPINDINVSRWYNP